MKICLLDLGKTMRGGQRQVLYLAERLNSARGFEPVVAAPQGSPLIEAARHKELETLPLPGSNGLNPRVFMSLACHILKAQPHWLHTNDAKGASLGAMLKKIAPAKFRLLHTRRVSYPLKTGMSTSKYLLADTVAAVSEEIRQGLISSGLDPSTTVTIHSGIDPKSYPEKTIAPNPPVIGLIGAMTSQKGHDLLLEALNRPELKENPDWKALLVGDGPLLEEMRDKRRTLGLNQRVEFTGFRESREVLPGLSLLAVPSLDGEGSSATIKEAWAVGVPVLASDLPSNAELVEHGESGLLFARGDAADLAEKTLALLKDPKLCNALVTGGRNRLKKFTDQVMAERYMTLYQKI